MKYRSFDIFFNLVYILTCEQSIFQYVAAFKFYQIWEMAAN